MAWALRHLATFAANGSPTRKGTAKVNKEQRARDVILHSLMAGEVVPGTVLAKKCLSEDIGATNAGNALRAMVQEGLLTSVPLPGRGAGKGYFLKGKQEGSADSAVD